MGDVGICSRGRMGFCSVGGLGLDSIICERRIDGEARGAGPGGRNNPIRRAVRTQRIVGPMSVRMAYLAEICCESGSRYIMARIPGFAASVYAPVSKTDFGIRSKFETPSSKSGRNSKFEW